MKLLLILSFLFSILSQYQVLTVQASPNVMTNSFESTSPVKSLGNANDGALELCQNNFPDGKLVPESSHYINDGCIVVCLVGIDEWHKLPNQIGNLCPFNLRGTCDTDGRCHNEGPVKLGYVGMDIWNLIFINFLNIPAMDMYFVVAHIRNSSEPWPLASMDYTDSAAHCNTRSSPGPIYPIWDQHCDIGSQLFKDTARLFLYVYGHKQEDPYKNVQLGSTSATIFEILQSQQNGSTTAIFNLEPVQALMMLNFTFTPI